MYIITLKTLLSLRSKLSQIERKFFLQQENSHEYQSNCQLKLPRHFSFYSGQVIKALISVCFRNNPKPVVHVYLLVFQQQYNSQNKGYSTCRLYTGILSILNLLHQLLLMLWHPMCMLLTQGRCDSTTLRCTSAFPHMPCRRLGRERTPCALVHVIHDLAQADRVLVRARLLPLPKTQILLQNSAGCSKDKRILCLKEKVRNNS